MSTLIRRIETWEESFPLTRPYRIAYKTQDSMTSVICRITTDHHVGYGAASPSSHVTQETVDDAKSALAQENLQWLIGADVRTLPSLCRQLAHRIAKPAARAAVDVALHDLFAQHLGLPLVSVLGAHHKSMATSITIGIKDSVEETLTEAKEYVERGFRILKVKIGLDLEEDIRRLHRVREAVGLSIGIRVDPNQGYSMHQLRRFFELTDGLGLEFIEQPLKVTDVQELAHLGAERRHIAIDENLLAPYDALQLLPLCGIFNIKLMKCGGIAPALRIAAIAEEAGTALMWGCNDESRITIAAALHAAFASPATRYIDLDGSLDLAADIVSGGFELQNGMMSPLDKPGLGLTFLDKR